VAESCIRGLMNHNIERVKHVIAPLNDRRHPMVAPPSNEPFRTEKYTLRPEETHILCGPCVITVMEGSAMFMANNDVPKEEEHKEVQPELFTEFIPADSLFEETLVQNSVREVPHGIYKLKTGSSGCVFEKKVPQPHKKY
jgi:hypothetical protein